jgi:hypothetical protein
MALDGADGESGDSASTKLLLALCLFLISIFCFSFMFSRCGVGYPKGPGLLAWRLKTKLDGRGFASRTKFFLLFFFSSGNHKIHWLWEGKGFPTNSKIERENNPLLPLT